MNKFQIGAYFYPISTACKQRAKRAKKLGYDVVDEVELCRNATPLFEGHNQPLKYCLGEMNTQYWDDADLSSMIKQVRLAKQNGLDFFIFDTYMGCVGEEFIKELSEPLDKAFLGIKDNDFKFATMLCMGRPRVILPEPKIKGFEEQDRFYDISERTIHSIVDYSYHNYWGRDNYLRIDGKPYVSFIDHGFGDHPDEHDRLLNYFTKEIKDYAMKKYSVEIYLVGVFYTIEIAYRLERANVDALTGYGFLANIFGKRTEIQDYAELVAERKKDWETLKNNLKIPMVPPVVVGWDTSPRGERNTKIEEVEGIYPYTPVVVNSSPSKFEHMLKLAIQFVRENVPDPHQYTLISAWNEIGQSCALLPQIIEDEVIDDSYLKVIKNLYIK